MAYKKICGIYKITSPSGRVYIGQSRNIKGRFCSYKNLHSTTKGQIKLFRSFKKHGVENHTFEIIEECEFEELNIKERYWQDFYNVLNGGLNCHLTCTEILPHVMSEETKEKMRLAKLGNKASKETCKKLSEMRRGENNSFFGRKHSEKSKNKQKNKALKRLIQPAAKKLTNIPWI